MISMAPNLAIPPRPQPSSSGWRHSMEPPLRLLLGSDAVRIVEQADLARSKRTGNGAT